MRVVYFFNLLNLNIEIKCGDDDDDESKLNSIAKVSFNLDFK